MDAEKWLAQFWAGKNRAAAAKEGWDIFDSHGSANGPWQIQHFDCIDDPETQGQLLCDEDAWMLVMRGTGEHHKLAREFIEEQVPVQEWKFINEWYKRITS